MRITAACPASLVDDANQLAMCLGQSEADGQTFGPLNWQDDTGALYSCASWEASEEWFESVSDPLVRPEWDTGELIDMDAAAAAQAALLIWSGEDDLPIAESDSITVIPNMDGLSAIAAMGLVQYEPPEAL